MDLHPTKIKIKFYISHYFFSHFNEKKCLRSFHQKPLLTFEVSPPSRISRLTRSGRWRYDWTLPLIDGWEVCPRRGEGSGFDRGATLARGVESPEGPYCVITPRGAIDAGVATGRMHWRSKEMVRNYKNSLYCFVFENGDERAWGPISLLLQVTFIHYRP